jgi:hypothetical protein
LCINDTCNKRRLLSSKTFASSYDGRGVYCIIAEKINEVVKRLVYLENDVSRVQLEWVFEAELAKSGIIKL